MNTLHILFCEYHKLAYTARIMAQKGYPGDAGMYADAAFEILRTMNTLRKVIK